MSTAENIKIDRDDDGYVVFRVPVDDAVVAWLMEIADLHHAPPALIIAAIVRDVWEDDQSAHDSPVPPPDYPSLN